MQNQILQGNTEKQSQCRDNIITVLYTIIFFKVFGAVTSRLWAQAKDSGKSVMPAGNTGTCNKYTVVTDSICLVKTGLDQLGLCSTYQDFGFQNCHQQISH